MTHFITKAPLTDRNLLLCFTTYVHFLLINQVHYVINIVIYSIRGTHKYFVIRSNLKKPTADACWVITWIIMASPEPQNVISCSSIISRPLKTAYSDIKCDEINYRIIILSTEFLLLALRGCQQVNNNQ